VVDPLAAFSEPIRTWFTERYGRATEIQALTWPRIARGEHVLVSAPTGSGKTLTAFLSAIDRLASGEWEGGALRVLYVSPLKALGTDIRRNLELPLAELPAYFEAAGLPTPVIRAATRSGDTPQAERRRMIRHPPEILITTPESLNILLTSRSGRAMLETIRCLIVDEIHAVAGSKRGAHLATAVERLVLVASEFQRIALSATIHPLEDIARWVGGHRLTRTDGEPVYQPRDVAIVRSDAPKPTELEVVMPLDPDAGRRDPDALWENLTLDLSRRIHRNTATLVFGNSRRTVEKVTRLLNEAATEILVYSHHGALSREIRSLVEERMKLGTLKAIVATSSLELGIDVGSIDEVALLQCPPSVASAVQRLGRSGHGVGDTRRGVLYPLHPRGLVEAAVLAPAMLAGEVEPIRPVRNALDVLAQTVLSMVVADQWHVDELYDVIRTAEPYRHLSRLHFDLVLDMLTGRYATTRLRPLRPLVSLDPVDHTVRARPGAERLLYMAGGTIPDRGYFKLRVESTGAPLGELDEEFVWERAIGDSFSLGVQGWRIQRITHNDVFVAPTPGAASMAPFWRAEELDRSNFLSDRLGRFLEDWSHRPDPESWTDELVTRHRFSPAAARELIRLLAEQEAATGVLPHRQRIVVEHTRPPGLPGGQSQVVIHTLWGGRVNRPFAYALAAAWSDRFGHRPEIVHDDDCVAITAPVEKLPEDLFELVPASQLDALLRTSLEETGFFGARFRAAAGIALILPRAGAHRRTPLWLNRQRAKELLELVARHDDFPLTLETWRSCVQDEFELDALDGLLREIQERRIEVVHVHTDRPSPFTQQVAWKQTNRLMYADDAAEGRRASRLRPDLVREVVFDGRLRPLIAPSQVEHLRNRLQRVAPGYAPRPGDDLLDWLVERVAVPDEEWLELVGAVGRDHAATPEEVLDGLNDRAVRLHLTDNGGGLVVAVAQLPRLERALSRPLSDLDPAPVDPKGDLTDALAARARLDDLDIEADDALSEVVAEWLRGYGPLAADRIEAVFGLDPDRLRSILGELSEDRVIVVDQLTVGATATEVCDVENLDRLLRLARADARPTFEPRPLDALPLFFASRHALGLRDAEPRDLQAALEPLFGWPAAAASWETELLPARIDPYLPTWLDALLAETDLRWIGCGPQRLLFSLESDRDLFQSATGVASESDPDDEPTVRLLPHVFGRYPLEDIVRSSGRTTSEVADTLWRQAWQGRVTADSFAPVRQAAHSGFRPSAPLAPDPPSPGHRGRRVRFERWRATRPFAGSWFVLEPSSDDDRDPLANEELRRDRARILLDRYGVVFRELAARELREFGWGTLFRSLRLMELGGEIVAGHFFDGVGGIQFASHQAVRQLEEGLAEDRIWWLNATDPCSPVGLGLPLWQDRLPRRVIGNHLVFHGRRLVIVSERRGARLDIAVPPDHPHVADYLRFLEVMLTRAVDPERSIVVETINGEPAPDSPYLHVLRQRLRLVRMPTGVRLERQYLRARYDS
jgi:ATP-dependent Lhr-like helicase